MIKEDKNMAGELTSIQNMIHEIRGQKVMLDSDLAKLYGVETFNLNKAVKRNIGRFPGDFMFQLSKEEWENLIFQIGISSLQHGGRRSMPYAFTEQGVAMLSSVLKSQKAIAVNIQIMRAFVKLRHYALSQNGTDEQIAELRKLLMLYIEKNDKRVNDIIIALNNLLEKPKETKRIGFRKDD
jgi:phage regulator Rha-like protein